jgi:hypothetical protein
MARIGFRWLRILSNYRHSPNYAVVTFQNVRHESNFSQVGFMHTYSQFYKHIHKKQSSWNPYSNTLEPDRSQHKRTSVCVIAQQYSSAIIASLQFYPHSGNLGAQLKFSMFQFFNYFLIASVRSCANFEFFSVGAYLQLAALFTFFCHTQTKWRSPQATLWRLSSARTVRTFETTGAVQLPRILMGCGNWNIKVA